MLKSDFLDKVVKFLVAEEVGLFWSPELDSQARSLVSDEVRKKELELEREKMVAVNRKESRNANRHFDIAKNVRMVPPFEEEGVEKYFPHCMRN